MTTENKKSMSNLYLKAKLTFKQLKHIKLIFFHNKIKRGSLFIYNTSSN